MPHIRPMIFVLLFLSSLFLVFNFIEPSQNDLKITSVELIKQGKKQQLLISMDTHSIVNEITALSGIRVHVRASNVVVLEQFVAKQQGLDTLVFDLPSQFSKICVFVRAVGENGMQLKDPSLANNYLCVSES